MKKMKRNILISLFLLAAMLLFTQAACADFYYMTDGAVIRPGECCLISYRTRNVVFNTPNYVRINVYDPEGHIVFNEQFQYTTYDVNIYTEFIPDKEGTYKVSGYEFYYLDGLERINSGMSEITLYSIKKCETHTWGEWYKVQEPTCTEPGEEDCKCTVCYVSKWRDIPAKGHDWTDEKIITEPTCTTPGKASGTCKTCGKTGEYEIPINPNAHVWGEPAYTWAEDCSRVDASRACTENPAHTESETAATTSSVKREATYADMGITTYTAVFVNPAFGKVEKDVENIPRKVLGAVTLSSLKAGKQELTVKWKKGTDNDGYEIEYGLKKSFKGAKKVTVTKAKTTCWVIGKLKAKKTYYVRIRAWKKVGGNKYYSEWSRVLSKKVK